MYMRENRERYKLRKVKVEKEKKTYNNKERQMKRETNIEKKTTKVSRRDPTSHTLNLSLTHRRTQLQQNTFPKKQDHITSNIVPILRSNLSIA